MLNYSPLLLLVVSGAALAAGLPEATAAGRRARWVYYSAPPFWLFLVVMFLVYFVTTLLPLPFAARSPSYRHPSSVHHPR
jgi:hypothetical protein